MLAVIQKAEAGYTARFERYWTHSTEEVWSWLTDNDKLPIWFSELRVDELREGGVIKFDMQDGTFEDMVITELRTGSVLEYTWDTDRVRFELYEDGVGGCKLVFTEIIKAITNHTPRDIAGWDVCLDVIGMLLDGEGDAVTPEFRKGKWEVRYEQYVRMFAELNN
ncbi:SRPBCC family protein [Paenibacillus sp. YIM B09110]|uniref:SRPBCC family protein n=1 Tax=Paenibacillus sp. YIM B09110 TaxID=3126102 RepID=UPI00301CDA4A